MNSQNPVNVLKRMFKNETNKNDTYLDKAVTDFVQIFLSINPDVKYVGKHLVDKLYPFFKTKA